jgi:hypothetical protein
MEPNWCDEYQAGEAMTKDEIIAYALGTFAGASREFSSDSTQ